MTLRNTFLHKNMGVQYTYPFLLNLKSVSCSKFKSGGDRLLLMPLIMRTDFLSGHQIRQTCGLLAGNQNFRATKKAPPGC